MLLKLKFLTIQVLKEMTVEGKEKALLKKIRHGNQLDEQESVIIQDSKCVRCNLHLLIHP